VGQVARVAIMNYTALLLEDLIWCK